MIRKFILAGTLTAAVLGTTAQANSFSATTPGGEQLSLSELIEKADTSISDVIPLPIRGMSAVESDDGTIMFVSDTGRFAIVGELVDVWQAKTLDSMRDIQEAVETMNLRSQGIDVEKLNVASVGTGPKEVVVFVDPICSTCTSLMEDAEKLAADYTFRFLVIPAFGDESNELARHLFCASNPEERYQALRNGAIRSLDRKSKCPMDYYDQTLLITHLLGIDGVPYILSHDDKTYRGRPANLGQWLSGSKE